MKFFSAEWWDSLTDDARDQAARWWLASSVDIRLRLTWSVS